VWGQPFLKIGGVDVGSRERVGAAGRREGRAGDQRVAVAVSTGGGLVAFGGETVTSRSVVVVPDQTAKQQARRVALDAQTQMRARRAEQERRRSMLAVTVVTALAERDAAVRACESRAGAALRALTDAEGLSVREAVEWCGGTAQLSVREAARLRQAAAPAKADTDTAAQVAADKNAADAVRPPPDMGEGAPAGALHPAGSTAGGSDGA
jgi:hypothetical protein